LTRLIIRLLIDNRPRKEQERRLRFGVVGGACGIVMNILLALMKAGVGLIFGSIAIVADAVNNMTDAASSVITLVGFKLAARKPDTDHPYGHGRIEYISGLVMAFLVLVLGGMLVKSAVESIISPEKIVFSYVTVAILVLSVLGKLWLSLFYRNFEKQTGSKTFAAAAQDCRNDVLSTAAVLAATVIYAIWGVNLDGYIGLAVSVFIVISGIKLIKETLDPLLGQPPEKELVEEIYTRVMAYEGVIGIHDLVVHNYGPGRVFASLHAEVPATRDLLESHDLIDNIEKEFLREMNLEVVIHIDPIITDSPVVNHFRHEVLTILHGIDPGLSIHDFRAVVGPTHTNLIFDILLPADFKGEEKQLKAEMDEALNREHPECFTVVHFDRSYV
jgi:cation diffusion facilitator family transporter